jgi:hypothetical protein
VGRLMPSRRAMVASGIPCARSVCTVSSMATQRACRGGRVVSSHSAAGLGFWRWPRRQAHSSTPMAWGAGVARTGTVRPRRRRVDARVDSRRRAASRAPACPPRVTPIARRVVMSRVVLRAYGATNAGRRAVKMRRAQRAFRQMNFRTITWIRTARAPQGRSVTWRP